MPTNNIDTLSSLFLSLRTELLDFARRRTNGHDAEDIVQDAYVNLYTRSDTGQWREPRAFLFRTISNLLIDRWRIQQRRQGHQADVTETEEIACQYPNPEKQLIDKQRLRKLLDVLDELPEINRHAFVLNRIDGLGHTEIAALLGVSCKTVQRYIERTIQHCLNRLDG